MALPTVLADRVRETNTVTGTGAVTLGGSVAGFQTFSAVLTNGQTTWYAIIDNTANAWEVGLGTWNTGNTLTRTTVLASTNANALVSFAGNACDCFIDIPAYAISSLLAVLTNTSANYVWAGPTSGGAAAPAFRSLVAADVPAANLASSGNGGVTGVLPAANGGTGVNNGSYTITLAGNISVAGALTTSGAYSVTHTYPGAYNYTFPSATSTLLASTIEDQTVSGGAIVTSKSITLTGTVTLDPGARPLQYGTNTGAVTIAAPANDGSAAMLITNSASAGAITFSGFSVGSSTGDTYATTSGNKYTLFYWRINGTSGYRWAAHQ